MTPLAQNLLYLTSIVILLGTLVVFVMQYVRSRRGDKDDRGDGPDRDDTHDAGDGTAG